MRFREDVPGGDGSMTQQGRSNFKWGIVEEVFPDTGRVRIMFEDNDATPTWEIQLAFPKTKVDKFYWMPDIGEEVQVLVDEQGEEALCIWAHYNEVDTPPLSSLDKFHILFKDGSWLQYDRASGRLVFASSQSPFFRYEEGTFDVLAQNINLFASEQIALMAPTVCAPFIPGPFTCIVPPPTPPDPEETGAISGALDTAIDTNALESSSNIPVSDGNANINPDATILITNPDGSAYMMRYEDFAGKISATNASAGEGGQ